MTGGPASVSTATPASSETEHRALRALCKTGIGIPANGSLLGSHRRQWEAAGGLGLDLYPLAAASIIVIAAAGVWQGGSGSVRRPRDRLGASPPGRQLPASTPAPRAPRHPRHVRPREIRRQSASQSQVALLPGRPAVPGGPRAPAPAEGQLRGAGRGRGTRLPGRRARVPVGGNPGAGRQRRPGQQEDADHPPAPAARHPQRRGAQQAAGRGDHRPGRRPAQHPGRAAAQEDPELQEMSQPHSREVNRSAMRCSQPWRSPRILSVCPLSHPGPHVSLHCCRGALPSCPSSASFAVLQLGRL